MMNLNPGKQPRRENFGIVADWCESSLTSQHGPDVGAPFADLIRTLAAIAEISTDVTADRFEQRKAAEARIDDLLIELAASHSESLQARQLACPAADRSSSADASQGTYLFVYGTLKRGFSRSQAMRQQRFAGEARTVPKYRMFDCGSYPGLVEFIEDGISIEGEVWEVDAESLARLDEIEGVRQNLYARRKIELQSPFEQCEVESYFFQRSVVGLHDCGAVWS